MTERVYPILPDDKMNFMMDKQKALREKLTHYKKVKNKWSVVSTTLRACGISVTCLAAGASATVAYLSVPIVVPAVLAGVLILSITFTESMIRGFTDRRKKYFRQKCDHIKDYLNKMETLFIKCKEDGQISPEEFEQFQKLHTRSMRMQ